MAEKPKIEDRNWLRRFRSSSFSSEMGCDESEADSIIINSPTIQPTQKSKLSEHSLSQNVSGIFLENNHYYSSLVSGRNLLEQFPDSFPFSALTTSIKIAILLFLDPSDRGSFLLVNQELNKIIKNPDLWRRINLTKFPKAQSIADDTDTELCTQMYEAYKKRCRKYFNFLIALKPRITHLIFSYDIGDVKDGWLEAIQTLLRSARLDTLSYANLGWHETPIKPAALDSVSATWCTNDYKDLMYRHRHRQRYFVKFFDLFSSVGTSITELVVPFDWTERSIRSLSRFTSLQKLTLERYFIFQNVDQKQIDLLISSCPEVKSLSFEVWTPSGRGLLLFKLKSDKLQKLNVSGCRGFYFEQIFAPELKHLKMGNSPMKGPIVSTETHEPARCMFTTLTSGCPKLSTLNGLLLEDGWNSKDPAEKINAVLKTSCPCPLHAKTY